MRITPSLHVSPPPTNSRQKANSSSAKVSGGAEEFELYENEETAEYEKPRLSKADLSESSEDELLNRLDFLLYARMNRLLLLLFLMFLTGLLIAIGKLHAVVLRLTDLCRRMS